MSAQITQTARYFRDKARKSGAPLTADALATNVRQHTTLDFSIDAAVDALIRQIVARVLRERDQYGRMYFPCEWADGKIAQWQHRDELTIAGWQLNLDERVEQAENDKRAKRRIAIVIEVLAAAKTDAGREVAFSECETEIMRRWQKAKVAP